MYLPLKRSMYTEENLRKEGLDAVKSCGERAESIMYNVDLIKKNKQWIAQEEKKANPNVKFVKRCKDTIENCKQTVKVHLSRLGADENVVAEVFARIDDKTTEQLQYCILKLLVKRNPGLYSRKLSLLEKSVKQK